MKNEELILPLVSAKIPIGGVFSVKEIVLIDKSVAFAARIVKLHQYLIKSKNPHRLHQYCEGKC